MSRLLVIMLGRSKAVFTAWLNQQIPAFRSSVEIVVMDGLPGFKTAAVEAINKAITAVSCGVSAELPELRKLGRTCVNTGGHHGL
ncbi:MAG: transposase, partial [Propionibacterium sp.]|nr:transposase [Propionibacterium sp.]